MEPLKLWLNDSHSDYKASEPILNDHHACSTTSDAFST